MPWMTGWGCLDTGQSRAYLVHCCIPSKSTLLRGQEALDCPWTWARIWVIASCLGSLLLWCAWSWWQEPSTILCIVQVLAATQTPGEGGKEWFQGTADAVRQYLWLFEVSLAWSFGRNLECQPRGEEPANCYMNWCLKFCSCSEKPGSLHSSNVPILIVTRMPRTRTWRMSWFCQEIICTAWTTWTLCRWASEVVASFGPVFILTNTNVITVLEIGRCLRW